MNEAIRILIVEDMPADAELAKWEIRRTLPASVFRRVETREHYLAALEEFQPDVIVSDYSMPHFDGLTALKLALERVPLTPLIILTGSMNEDTAVECMKAGASNYVIKEHIKRLGQSVIHALAEKQLREERYRAEQALRESEERYRSLYENATIGIYRTTPEGRILMANPAAVQLLGFNSFDELAQRNLEEEGYAPSYPRSKFRQQLESGEVITGLESAWLRQDGSTILVRESARVVRDEHGQVLYYDGTFEDITEHKQMETALRESEERLRQIASALREVIWLRDVQTRQVLYVNPAFEELTGRTCESFYENRDILIDAIHPDDKEPVTRALDQRFGSVPFDKEHRIIHLDGSVRWVSSRIFPVRNEAGEVYRWATIMEDITERKQAEQALRESEARYRARTEELEALFALATRLREAQTAVNILPALLREMQRVLKTDAVVAALLDPDSDLFTVALAEGSLAPDIGQTIGPAENLSRQALRSHWSYVTDDYATARDRQMALPHADEIGPATIVPLRSENEFLGVLIASRRTSPQAQPFSPEEVRLLAAMGEMAGNALRRARLFDDVQCHLRRTQALHDIQLAVASSFDLKITLSVALEHAIAQLGVDAAAVLLLDPNTLTLEYVAGRGFRLRSIGASRVRLGEGYAGRAVLERQSVHIPNLSEIEGKSVSSPLTTGEEFVAYYGVPLIAKGQVKGVLEVFHRAPLHADKEWLAFLETLAGQVAIAIDNLTLLTDLQNSNAQLMLAYDATIGGLSRALDLRDRETEGHAQRVAELAMRLARAMGMNDDELLHLRRGALLHDMGKIGIPDTILLKPDQLTPEEWGIMRRHPQYAFDMFSPIEYLRRALDIPYCHHEKWDGTGYPRGLKGQEIPLAARIFAVVDVWDALTSERPYRHAWSREAALTYIREQAGKHFDLRVVEAFLQILQEEQG